MLNQYLRQCEQETEKVGKLLERQYLLKEEFTREYNQAQNLAEKRKHQAEIAKQSGETDLMEFAVKESLHYEERALSLKEAHKSAEVQLAELERKYEEMKHVEGYASKASGADGQGKYCPGKQPDQSGFGWGQIRIQTGSDV